MEWYEPIRNISEQEARRRIAEWFPQQTKLYAVLDFAVCFGIYDHDLFLVGLQGQTAPAPLNWEYLRELRIFDEEKELFLIPSDCGWTGRMRRDTENGAEANKIANETREYVIDEYQKLWGRAKNGRKEGITDWTLLISERGTKIQIPAELGGHEEAAIHVRKYMRVPNVEQGEELVFQKDIRMVEFCPWEGGYEDGRVQQGL